MRLKDKTVIITGGGSGIGRAAAVLFAREGAKVMIHGHREENTAETLRLTREVSPEAEMFIGDVRKEEDMKRLADAAAERFGKIDILYNNAGIGYSANCRYSPIPEVTTEDWDRVFETNIRGVFYASKYALPYMIGQNFGVILNTASVNGVVGCGAETYSGTKGAIIAMSRAMAVEYGKYNIRVNVISPGTTRTPMVEELLETDDFRDYWGNVAPIRGIIEPEDVAQGALFLCSDESRFITGQNLVVDGGFTIS